MTQRSTSVALLALYLAVPASASANPLLKSADIRVAYKSSTTCDVTIQLEVEGTSSVEHRIESFDGASVALQEIRGASQAGEIRSVGRTLSLLVHTGSSASASYFVSYTATQPATRATRCPIWVPTVPTDGRSRPVTIEVQLPAGSSDIGGSLPAFNWSSGTGVATLGHVPSFVRVPFSGQGELTREWDVARVMDRVAVGTFLAATGFWIYRRRR